MVGLLQWNTAGRGLRPVSLKEISVCHVRFLCAEISRGPRTPETVARRRFQSAGKRLLRQGVERVALPDGGTSLPLPEGLRPVSTLPLRRALAADWCGELLRLRGERPASARVLVTAEALSGEVARTVTELALRHRYLLLAVPFGGEELARRLRREYGVSVVLDPTAEQAGEAALHVAFDPVEPLGGGFLPLYDETLSLPSLLLPREVEDRLPTHVDRAQLLSVLWTSGALRPGQVTLRLKTDETGAKAPDFAAFRP